MTNQEPFAVAFARTLHVLRQQPPVVDQQKAALRAVFALTSAAPATVRVRDGVLSVDDVAVSTSLEHVGELTAQMMAHGVVAVTITRGAPPAELLALTKALAVEPGGYPAQDSVERRVRDSGATNVMVVSVQHTERRPSVPRVSVAPAAESATSEEAQALAAWDRLHSSAADEEDKFAKFAPEASVLEPEPAAAPPPSEIEPASASAAAEPVDLPVPADTPLGRALLPLLRDPYGGRVLDYLTELSLAFHAAVESDQAALAVRAAAAAIALEPGAPEGSPRNGYAIALRRMLTKEVIAQVAAVLLMPGEFEAAASVMRRAGPDGSDVLLGLLASAESMKERKAYMNALRGVEHSSGLILDMLGRSQWFVVRNVAELCGELRIEEAVDDLSKLLGHDDVRVQRAAAAALARIGSRATVPPLLKLLKEGTRELRGLVAQSIGLRAAPALAMPLAALAADESSPELLREYYGALGRIGTSEAVQVLVKSAQPGGRLLGRRPLTTRLSAIQGLKLAGGQAALAALAALNDDSEKAVAAAAKAATEAIRAGVAGVAADS